MADRTNEVGSARITITVETFGKTGIQIASTRASRKYSKAELDDEQSLADMLRDRMPDIIDDIALKAAMGRALRERGAE